MDHKLGERIRQTRVERKLSRSRLAKAAQIAYSTLSDIELGRTAKTLSLHRIAAELKVRPEWLATGKGQKYLVGNGKAEPVQPESYGELTSAPATEQQSHLVRVNADILHEALTLLHYDEMHAGPYSPRAQSTRLADLYDRVAADGGRLTKEHNAEFDDEVQSRQQRTAHGADEPTHTRAPGRRRRAS
jgi:transcriptional regulator with XRE-family HTH domain